MLLVHIIAIPLVCSVLEPILFIMYINDICRVSQVFKYMYLLMIQIYYVDIKTYMNLFG